MADAIRVSSNISVIGCDIPHLAKDPGQRHCFAHVTIHGQFASHESGRWVLFAIQYRFERFSRGGQRDFGVVIACAGAIAVNDDCAFALNVEFCNAVKTRTFHFGVQGGYGFGDYVAHGVFLFLWFDPRICETGPLVQRAVCATLSSMGIKIHLHKSIVTALWLGVGFSTPVWAQSANDSDQLDLLFEQLREAPPEDAARLEGQIVALWGRSGSAAMDLLLRRGEDAIEDGKPDEAVEHFTALVDHAPDFAEAYNGRATAYYLMGLYGPAIDDLRQVLVLEPRHFGAMTGVAVILEEIERPEDALEVWRTIEEFIPSDPEVAAMIERLEVQLKGDTL